MTLMRFSCSQGTARILSVRIMDGLSLGRLQLDVGITSLLPRQAMRKASMEKGSFRFIMK
jgi:hypothetical protein